MKLFKTTDNKAERVEYLYPTAKPPFNKRVIYSCRLDDLKANDILSITCHGQVTNDVGYNMMFCWLLVLGDSSLATTGIELTEAKGTNVTPLMHHFAFSDFAHYQSAGDMKSVHINLVAYCASTASKDHDKLNVDQDYGRMSVLVFN